MRDDFDSFDDDFDDEFKKKSPLPAILIVLLIVALGGAGAFVIYLATSQEKPSKQVALVKTPDASEPVQIPVPTPTDSVKPQEKDSVQASKNEDTDIVTPKPVPKKIPVTTQKPRPRRRRPRTRPKPPTPSKPTTNMVMISSSPSGASVFIDGKRMGTTPFNWKKPYYGSVTVTLTKTGYEDLKESFKFTGGTLKKPFTLKKAAPKPPVVTRPSTPIVKTPITKPPVTKNIPKPPSPKPDIEEEEDIFDIGEEEDVDFDDEPVTTPTTKPPVSTPAPPPVTRPTTPPPSSGGGQASIFIASIPPVADVYLGDKLIGKTNVSELKIPAGVQTLKFVKGAKQITKQLTLKPGKNPSQMVRIP